MYKYLPENYVHPDSKNKRLSAPPPPKLHQFYNTLHCFVLQSPTVTTDLQVAVLFFLLVVVLFREISHHCSAHVCSLVIVLYFLAVHPLVGDQPFLSFHPLVVVQPFLAVHSLVLVQPFLKFHPLVVALFLRSVHF